MMKWVEHSGAAAKADCRRRAQNSANLQRFEAVLRQ
jgi:hypothetical protein